jgi:2-haloacid dehalogenase
MGKILVAFDLYGTLLSTESIAKALAAHFGQDKAASIAAVWRKYQLEYTWRLNSMSTLFRCFERFNIPPEGRRLG